MSFLKRREKIQKKWKIKKECLNLIFECAKSNYPKEFGGLLRVDDVEKDVITELVVLPGTISGDSHAIFQMHMRPVDFSIVGTVHSHPSPSFRPSGADLQLFGKFGIVNIIAAYPFNEKTWQAYNNKGNPLYVTVV